MAYRTSTISVIIGEGSAQKEVDLSDVLNQTFRFIKTYQINPADYDYVPFSVRYADNRLTVALTVRQEPRRNGLYWYAHWREPNYAKKLKKAYVGKEPTLEKLTDICDKFFAEFKW